MKGVLYWFKDETPFHDEFSTVEGALSELRTRLNEAMAGESGHVYIWEIPRRTKGRYVS